MALVGISELHPRHERRFFVVSLGSNADGAWGSPDLCLSTALSQLGREFGEPEAVSRKFITAAVGSGRQADFLNQIAVFRAPVAPARILMQFKRLERAAGRRTGLSRRWGPRPLDLDLIDHGGRVVGWRRSDASRPGPAVAPLVLPHPRAHQRAFVLVPLLEVLPHWWHPALGVSGARLLRRVGGRGVRPQVLDRTAGPCDKDT